MNEPCFLHVAINTPLRRLFDYLPGNTPASRYKPGQRLRVPFGNGASRVGLLVATSDHSDVPPDKLKPVQEILDSEPLINQRHLGLLEWASRYYRHPPGEVMLGTMPSLLSNGKPATRRSEPLWRVPAGKDPADKQLAHAPKQQAIVKFIQRHNEGVTAAQLGAAFTHWHSPVQSLLEKGLVEKFFRTDPDNATQHDVLEPSFKLNTEQLQAVTSVTENMQQYQCYLVNGVTGSGKTEIYIECIRKVLDHNRQVLVLVPEIGLTPQFIKRYRESLGVPIHVMHSGLTEREKLNTWLSARDHTASVLLGTRSAIWMPLASPGLIILDEEHDLSFKQQEGFRYSARDMALLRAQRDNIPVVLGSATPSLESLQNVNNGRFRELKLKQRAGNARLPHIALLDMRGSRMQGALSNRLVTAIGEVIDQGEQVLLFLNRRGYAPVMMCHDCGWISQCHRCDKYLTWHKQDQKLRCHHCDHEEQLAEQCPDCNGKQVIEVGHGTQRLTETLAACFPDAGILRIDRDSTRRKGTLESMLNDIQHGNIDILIGTQMLAKGHHFPRVTLAVIVDADRGLYSTDFRASERLAQIIMQVSGRAGRADQPGEVLIQTHYPEHPFLKTLIDQGYEHFAELALRERRETALPPFSYLVLLRAEAHNESLAENFLNNAGKQLSNIDRQRIQVYGPMAAPIRKKAGKYRMQLLLQATNRKDLHRILGPWIEALETAPGHRKVRWSVDIDPQDML